MQPGNISEKRGSYFKGSGSIEPCSLLILFHKPFQSYWLPLMNFLSILAIIKTILAEQPIC